MNLTDLKEHYFGDSDADVTDAYVAAFIAGAVGLFAEVDDRELLMGFSSIDRR